VYTSWSWITWLAAPRFVQSGMRPEQPCACDLRLPENCDGQVYPPAKLSITPTAKLMRAALYKDVRLPAHSARESGSGLLFCKVVRLSQCVTQPVSGILESVQQNVVGQSSVKQRVRRKYGPALGTVGQREGGLAAIHGRCVKYAVKRMKSVIQITGPSACACARARMYFHRCAHTGYEVSR
jgi:hypothetical protein